MNWSLSKLSDNSCKIISFQLSQRHDNVICSKATSHKTTHYVKQLQWYGHYVE